MSKLCFSKVVGGIHHNFSQPEENHQSTRDRLTQTNLENLSLPNVVGHSLLGKHDLVHSSVDQVEICGSEER